MFIVIHYGLFQLLADNYIKLSSALVDLAALEAGTPSTVATSANGDEGNNTIF